MHEGHHGILDDIEDMDDLFGISEEHDHDHCHGHHHHDHDHDHNHEHSDDKHNKKKKFGLFKKKQD